MTTELVKSARKDYKDSYSIPGESTMRPLTRDPKGRCPTPAESWIGSPLPPFLGKPTRLRYGLRPRALIPGDPGQRPAISRLALSTWKSENQRLRVGITKVAYRA